MPQFTIDKRNTVTRFTGNNIAWRNSYELNLYVSRLGHRKTYLSFSCGKDSVATYLYMKECECWDKIVPVFYYYAPDLSFEAEAVRYYEDILQTKIMVLPSPNTLTWVTRGCYQTPTSNMIAQQYREYIFECGFDDTDVWIREDNGDKDAFMATGVRMADGVNRRGVILQNGGLRTNNGINKFFPVFDFTDAEVAQLIAAHGVKLPYDYKIWGRTFDGPQYRFMKELKKELPDDYERFKTLYPLMDAVLLRYKAGRSDKLVFDETDFQP